MRADSLTAGVARVTSGRGGVFHFEARVRRAGPAGGG